MRSFSCFSIIITSLVLVSCSDSEFPSTNISPTSSPDEVTSQDDYDLLEQAALSGDYQAQRNLAYTVTTSIPYNPILGCAWRIVIIESGSDQVDQSDTGNKSFDCDKKLNSDELTAARAQALQLQSRIAEH